MLWADLSFRTGWMLLKGSSSALAAPFQGQDANSFENEGYNFI